jgi:hypothetical protein
MFMRNQSRWIHLNDVPQKISTAIYVGGRINRVRAVTKRNLNMHYLKPLPSALSACLRVAAAFNTSVKKISQAIHFSQIIRLLLKS